MIESKYWNSPQMPTESPKTVLQCWQWRVIGLWAVSPTLPGSILLILWVKTVPSNSMFILDYRCFSRCYIVDLLSRQCVRTNPRQNISSSSCRLIKIKVQCCRHVAKWDADIVSKLSNSQSVNEMEINVQKVYQMFQRWQSILMSKC